MPHAFREYAPLIQGTYFLATGVWPIVHLRSFEAVSGPKVDGWLVKTMGALIAVVGVNLILASTEREARKSARRLGLGSALALGTAEVIFAGKGRISRVYLLDAILEVGLIALWSSGSPKKAAAAPRATSASTTHY